VEGVASNDLLAVILVTNPSELNAARARVLASKGQGDINVVVDVEKEVKRARLIITIKCPARTSSTTMLTAEDNPVELTKITLPKRELLEIHRCKISLHHAKSGYDYPTTRLPHTFSKLAGISTGIYQTIYEGSSAFLTVISPTEDASKHTIPPSSHGGGGGFEFLRAHSLIRHA